MAWRNATRPIRALWSPKEHNQPYFEDDRGEVHILKKSPDLEPKSFSRFHNQSASTNYHVADRVTATKQKSVGAGRYLADQEILIVGDDNFSFSRALLYAFGTGSKLVATSHDDKPALMERYGHQTVSVVLDILERLGTRVMHGVSGTQLLESVGILDCGLFDRVVFNFPHTLSSSNNIQQNISINQGFLRQFFASAHTVLKPDGEVHVALAACNPYEDWNILQQAWECRMLLTDVREFRNEDYDGFRQLTGSPSKAGNRVFDLLYVFTPAPGGRKAPHKVEAVSKAQSYADPSPCCAVCKLRFSNLTELDKHFKTPEHADLKRMLPQHLAYLGLQTIGSVLPLQQSQANHRQLQPSRQLSHHVSQHESTPLALQRNSSVPNVRPRTFQTEDSTSLTVSKQQFTSQRSLIVCQHESHSITSVRNASSGHDWSFQSEPRSYLGQTQAPRQPLSAPLLMPRIEGFVTPNSPRGSMAPTWVTHDLSSSRVRASGLPTVKMQNPSLHITQGVPGSIQSVSSPSTAVLRFQNSAASSSVARDSFSSNISKQLSVTPSMATSQALSVTRKKEIILDSVEGKASTFNNGRYPNPAENCNAQVVSKASTPYIPNLAKSEGSGVISASVSKPPHSTNVGLKSTPISHLSPVNTSPRSESVEQRMVTPIKSKGVALATWQRLSVGIAFKCDLCRIGCTTKNSLSTHLAGQLHLSNTKKVLETPLSPACAQPRLIVPLSSKNTLQTPSPVSKPSESPSLPFLDDPPMSPALVGVSDPTSSVLDAIFEEPELLVRRLRTPAMKRKGDFDRESPTKVQKNAGISEIPVNSGSSG